MTQELAIRVSLNNEIFKDLKTLENGIKKFSDNVKKQFQLGMDFKNPLKKLAGDNPIKRIESSINRVEKTIKSTLTEVDRSIDAILKRVDKVFDNIFVGIDNLFSIRVLFRKFTLRIGTFFGDSRATLITILNDVIKLINQVTPFVTSLTRFINKNRKEIFEIIGRFNNFVKEFTSNISKSRDVTNKITSQAKKFITSSEFSILNNFIQARKLPIREQLGIFFETARRFFTQIIIQVERLIQTISFASNLSQREIRTIDQLALETSEKAIGNINRVGQDVFNLIDKVQKKNKGLFGQLFDFFNLLTTRPLKALVKFITFQVFGRFKLIGGLLNKLFIKPNVEAQRRKAELKREEEKQKALEQIRKQFIVRDTKERQEASNKVVKFLQTQKNEINELRMALVEFTKVSQRAFNSSVFRDATANESALRDLQRAATRDVASSLREFQKSAKTIDKSINRVFSTENTKQFKTSVTDINKVMVGLSGTIRRIQVDFREFFESLKKSSEVMEKTKSKKMDFSEPIKMAKKEVKEAVVVVDKLEKEFVDVVKVAQGLNFDKFKQIKDFKLVKTDPTFLNEINNLLISIARSQFQVDENFRKQSVASVNKNISKLVEFFTIFDAVLQNTNKELQRFATVLSKSVNLKFDGAKSQQLVKDVFKSFTGEELEKNKQLREFGSSVIKVLADSVRAGDKKAFEKGINDIVKFLANFIPKDKRLVDSGKKIPKQLAMGVEEEIKVFDKSMEKLAKTGGERFPQSLAKKGILRNLPKSGSLIPAQLAQGMLSNVGLVTNASITIANAAIAPLRAVVNQITKATSNAFKSFLGGFKSVIDEANKIGDISNATGARISEIEKIDSIFREVGQTASDNAIVFSRLQRTINDLGGDNENRLAQLGIDLNAVRDSGEPVVELFTEVSNVLSRVPPGSEEARVALEALGLTVDNKLVGVLRQGGDEIQRIVDASLGFGGAVNSEVIKVSQQLRSIFANLNRAFQAVKADFFGEVLPVVKDFFAGVLQFANENSQKIRGFFLFIGRAVGNLIRVALVFFKILVTEPRKAAKIASKTFMALVNLVKSITNSAIKAIMKNVTEEVKFKFLATLKGLKDSVFTILSLIGEQADLRIAQLLLLIEKGFLSIDKFIFNLGGSFLETTFEVAGRWLKIAGAVINEFWTSIKNFFLNIKDRLIAFLLSAQLSIQEAIRDIVASVPESLLDFFGLENQVDSLNAGIRRTADEIIAIEKRVNDRNNIAGFFERANKAVELTAKNLPTVDDLLDKVNAKIAASNERFTQGISDNFSKAFREADELIRLATESSRGLFDAEAVKEYNEAISEATSKIQSAVEGTELSEPVKKLINELSFEYIEKLQELKEAAPDVLIPEGTEDRVRTLLDLLEQFRPLFESITEVIGNFQGLFEDAFKASGEKVKGLFLISKGAALAQAVVNTALAVTEALKLPLPPPLPQVNATLAAARGGIQVGLIARQTIKGFREGGRIPGGEGGGDRVPIMAEAGEFMMPLKAVRENGLAFMEAIRSGMITAKDFALSGLPNIIKSPSDNRFADGGLVKSPVMNSSGSGGQNETMNQTTINVPDISMVGRFLSTEKGRRVILNVISDNAVEIKNLIG